MRDEMKLVKMQLPTQTFILGLMLGLLVAGGATVRPTTPASWLQRRAEFYRNTTFELSDNNVSLLGGKFAQVHSSHLPFWFDFELFKWVFKKSYANADEELIRHHTYIKTCVRSLRARVLYRILAGTKDTLINCKADAFYEERYPGAAKRNESAVGDEIRLSVLLEPTVSQETPLEVAVRLVREEFNRVESRNQLDRYLMECNPKKGLIYYQTHSRPADMEATEKIKSRWTRSFFTALNRKNDEEKYICDICHKDLASPSNLTLHRNTHVIERPYKCEPCQVSFNTQGHLQKHRRSSAHETRVTMTQAFGIPTTDNPRPYGCPECEVAFRKHGHLAKHLRSKSHIMKMESNGLVPIGTYAMLEKSGPEIRDRLVTTNCELSLQSLRSIAISLCEALNGS